MMALLSYALVGGVAVLVALSVATIARRWLTARGDGDAE